METADPVSVVGGEEDLAVVVVEVGVDLEATAEVDLVAGEEAVMVAAVASRINSLVVTCQSQIGILIVCHLLPRTSTTLTPTLLTDNSTKCNST